MGGRERRQHRGPEDGFEGEHDAACEEYLECRQKEVSGVKEQTVFIYTHAPVYTHAPSTYKVRLMLDDGGMHDSGWL